MKGSNCSDLSLGFRARIIFTWKSKRSEHVEPRKAGQDFRLDKEAAA